MEVSLNIGPRRSTLASSLLRTWRGLTRVQTVGLILSLLVLIIAVFGPWLAPHSPLMFYTRPFQEPTWQYPLGTDILGRDVLSRLLFGGRTILGMAATATVLGVLVGAILGIIAAYSKGIVDQILMRGLDAVMAFPQIILALLFVSILGSQAWLIIAIVATLHVPQVARVARAATLRIAEEDFVRYAEAIGLPLHKVLGGEILPNIATPLAVEFGLRMTYSIGIIAGLSFLGLGTPPPAPDWGLMINENRIGLFSNPWGVIGPIVLIAAITIGVNLTVEAMAKKKSKSGGSND